MKKKQRHNMITAFEELNAPDKDVLLQKIESKKAFGGQFDEETQAAPKTTRKKRVAWTSFACSIAVVVIALIIISVSVFRPKDSNGDLPPATSVNIVDYRSDWTFTYDNKICFDEIDKTMKDAGIELIYDYNKDWTISETQITQDESGYREYYDKDGISIEVTVLLESHVTSVDSRYSAIFRNINGSFIRGNYRVYDSYYYVDGTRKKAYLIYLKDKVFIFTSDVDMKDLIK